MFLARKIERGIPVLFCDTGQHMPETYLYRDWLADKWKLNLINASPTVKYEDVKTEKARCCVELKEKPLRNAIRKNDIKALVVGIRWDEDPDYSDTPFISTTGSYVKIHPILHWAKEDVWSIIKTKDVSYNPLYDEGYKNIDCKPCMITESSNRKDLLDEEKKRVIERLKSLGYI